MALTDRDIELIGLKAGEAAHNAIHAKIGDLKRIMREEASQIVQQHRADCPVKKEVKGLGERVKVLGLSHRKLLFMVAGASIGGGAVSRLPDLIDAIKHLAQ